MNLTLERQIEIMQEAQKERAKQCCRCEKEFQTNCHRKEHCPKFMFKNK